MIKAKLDQKKNDLVLLALASWPQPCQRRGSHRREWCEMQGHFLWLLLPPQGGWDSDTPWPGSLNQPWSCPQFKELSDSGFTVGKDLHGLWWVALKCSQTIHPSGNQSGPALPGTSLGYVLFHLPPSSSIALIYSASIAGHNCKYSLNK